MKQSFSWPRNEKWLWLALVAGCAVIAYLSFRASIHKILTLDEALLATRAHFILAEGFSGPRRVLGVEGLTHPPLYEATLALLFRMFGEKEMIARGFGVLGYLLIALFLNKTLPHLQREKSGGVRFATSCLVMALFLVNPLLIQHAMLVDAETGLSAALAAGFICLFVVSEGWGARRYIYSRLVLGAIFTAIFFSKEVTPFFLLAGVLAYRLLARDRKRFFADLFWIGGTALALVSAGIWLYQSLTGETLEIFLRKQYSFRTSRIFSVDFFLRVFHNLPMIARWPVFWVSAPFYLPLLFYFLSRAGCFLKSRRVELQDYLLLTTLIVWIPYLLVKPSIDMMKFQYSVYPWFILLISLYAAEIVGAGYSTESGRFSKVLGWACTLLLVSAAAGVYYYRLGDYLQYLSYSPEYGVWKRFLFSYFWPLAAVYAAAAIFFFRRFLRIAILLSLVLTLAINISLDLRQRVAYTTVESWLNYGERGMREVVEYLSNRPLKDRIISVRADIYYYLEYRGRMGIERNIETWSLFNQKDPVRALQTIHDPRFDYVVVDNVQQAYIPMKTRAGLEVLKNFHLVRQFGDFRVLRSNRLKGAA